MTTMMMTLLRAALQDRKGIASLEYAVLAVGILTGLFVAVGAVATKLDPIFATTIPGLL